MAMRVLLALLVFLTAAPSFAQDRAVPESEAQVKLSFAPIVKKVAPSVVNIYTKRVVSTYQSPFMNDPLFAPFFNNGQFGGRMRKQVENALGSGVIIASDGLVVTNAHVARGAEEITVVLSDGREFDAKLALIDDSSDLALLRFDTKGEVLPHAALKPSETLEVGDLVLAIGNPFGVGQTVTSGIVSALARSSLNINDFNFFIQTDAAINPGNSGGPLVDLDGDVVGINSAIYSRDGGSLGIGFAIPSEMVASVIAAEKSGGDGQHGVVRPWLGVTVQSVTSDIAQSLGMDRPMGALIAKLHAASPLRKAGLAVGDVALSINGHEIRDPSEMKFRMATVKLGDKAQVEVMRKGARMDFEVPAMAPPDDPPRQQTTISGKNPLSGIVIANLNPAVAVELGYPADDAQGVVVLSVPVQGAAGNIVAPGDMLIKINGAAIKAPEDAQKALAQGGKGWSFIVKGANGRVRQMVIR